MRDLTVLKSLQLLYIGSRNLTDSGMEDIGRMSQLRELDLSGSAVGADGIRSLQRLRNLSRLQLGQSIDDSALAAVARLRQLDDLDLEATRVTDAGLKALLGMKLKSLALPRRALTDLGLKHYLAVVPAPVKLDLSKWTITNAGMKEIGKITDLRHLNISNARINDDGMKEIAGLTQLVYLEMMHTKVTDDGLRELFSLRQLRYLNLTRTRVSPRGLTQFRQAHPNVKIVK